MAMKVLSLTKDGIDVCLEAARIILEKDGAVIIPTETVYGIAVRADSQKALAFLRRLKQRECAKALPLQVAKLSQLRGIAKVPRPARALFKAFSPGPLTVVLPPAGKVDPLLCGEMESVGVRIPKHDFVQRLLLHGPLAVPSANPVGEKPALTIKQAKTYFPFSVDLAIDGGRCETGVSSTVVGITEKDPFIFREGPISEAAIRKVLA